MQLDSRQDEVRTIGSFVAAMLCSCLSHLAATHGHVDRCAGDDLLHLNVCAAAAAAAAAAAVTHKFR
jgi:hypothetical protein